MEKSEAAARATAVVVIRIIMIDVSLSECLSALPHFVVRPGAWRMAASLAASLLDRSIVSANHRRSRAEYRYRTPLNRGAL